MEEAQAISDEADQIPPGPFRMDYQHFRTPSKVAIKNHLNAGPDAERLAPVQYSTSVLEDTLHAGMLELQTRLRLPGLLMLSPMTCISLATHEARRDFTRGSNKETFEELLRQISASSLVLCPVHGSGHWTYLAAQSAPGQEQWTLTYVDSLPAEIGTCYQAATSIAKNLKLLPADKSLPHSWPGQQSDGWSCGLWVLQDMETRIRAARKEVPTRPPNIGQIMARLNEFISKIRPHPRQLPRARPRPSPRPRRPPSQCSTPRSRRPWRQH